MKLGHPGWDQGEANAAMSYGRMKERETQLAAEVAELLERAREWMKRKTGGTAGTAW